MSNFHRQLQPLVDPCGGSFRRLHPFARLGHRVEACAQASRGQANCHRCVEACPQGALQKAGAVLELDPFACTACGLCMTVCPTLALTVEDCALPPAADGQPLLIACEPVARTLGSRKINRTVPCLAAIAVSDYLQLALDGAAGVVQVLDGDTCGACPILKGGENPAWSTLAQARRALTAVGVAPGALPQRVSPGRLPEGNAAPVESVSGRRGFMAGLSRTLVSGLTLASRPPAAPVAGQRQRVTASRGELNRALLLQLAQRQGREAPTEAWLPELVSTGACQADGVCVRACPAGALRLDSNEGVATLRVDPWRCSACGLCERVCPTHSLRSGEPAWRDAVDNDLPLAVVALTNCRRCNATLPRAAGVDLCDACGKAARLAAAGFALFDPARAASPTTDHPPACAIQTSPHHPSGPNNN